VTQSWKHPSLNYLFVPLNMFIELHNFGQLRSSSLWARGDTKLGQSGFERAAFTTLERPCQTRACFARKEKNSYYDRIIKVVSRTFGLCQIQ
jgi:hypothetical protein